MGTQGQEQLTTKAEGERWSLEKLQRERERERMTFKLDLKG